MASGIPRGKYAAVHGCSRTERCENEKCKAEFFRDFEIDGLSFQKTGRMCSLCNCALTDTLLDWEDALPAEDLARAEDEIEKPGTVLICLGTSLRIKPVGDLPELAEKYVIVNLQVTPHDEKAALVIRAPVDDVMSELMQQLGYHSWQDEEPPGIERVWQPPHLKKNNNNKST